MFQLSPSVCDSLWLWNTSTFWMTRLVWLKTFNLRLSLWANSSHRHLVSWQHPRCSLIHLEKIKIKRVWTLETFWDMWKLATRWCLNIWIFEYWIFPDSVTVSTYEHSKDRCVQLPHTAMIFDIFRLWLWLISRKVTDQKSQVSQESQDGDSAWFGTKLENQIICLMSDVPMDVWCSDFINIFRRKFVSALLSVQVRGLAKQMGIDLNTVKGTGAAGAAGAAPPVPLPVWVRARPDPSISLDIPRYPSIPSCHTSCNWRRKQSASRVQPECSREVKWSEWSEQEEGGLGSNLVVQESRSLTESNWV